MDQLKHLVDIVLHLDRYLNSWAATMGGWMYALLFFVVFCETGLVITPFLPGDSLLFAVGALSATPGSPVSLPLVMGLLFIAAVLGDAVNYQIGLRVGPRAFTGEDTRLLNKKHVRRAQAFYEKHGGKAIILARFVPIVRTFAPFVAGIGQMTYRRFFMFNVVGAAVWVLLLAGAGRAFGDLPIVKNNFETVILGIVFVSVLPMVVEWIRARRESASVPASASKEVVPND